MSRRDIYYWKCDRPAAFHGTSLRQGEDAEIAAQLRLELARTFATSNVELKPASGQGNHLTWQALMGGRSYFIRVENGPEKDGHLAVESTVLDRVRGTGVVTPRVFGCDASRSRVPFAWQALELISSPDLNQAFKRGTLQVPHIAFGIGQAVARWQSLSFTGFGILELGAAPHELRGPHATYAGSFHLRLEQHLHFLKSRGFLQDADEILTEIEAHHALLDLSPGCLVHKDLALWNILGSDDRIAAFIDFDDAISGDAMDDLSLLACFHDEAFLSRAFEGYQSLRPLPPEHLRRFWLHLLRNMIVKSVIRVGAGYFERDDGFFLIGSGASGGSLRTFTLARLALALRGLREGAGLQLLSS